MTNDKGTEKKIRETIPFNVAPITIKYLWVALTKLVEDLYEKTFRH